MDIVMREISLFTSSQFNFKELALEEVKKYSRARLVLLASSLIQGIEKNSFRIWGEPGIRAQLLDIKERKLEMDFVIEGDDQSMHILNAVSPAFTCSIPFAQYICNEIKTRLNGKAVKS